MFKKSVKTLFVLGIALSSASLFAVTTKPTYDNNLKLALADLQSGPEFNIGVVWLKPGASNLNYAILNKALPAQSPTWNEQELSPAYTPGLTMGFRYIFPHSGGQDIHLDWTHLSTNTSSSVSADGSSYFIGPDYEIGPSGIPIRQAVGNVKFKYDIINLDAGQFIDFGHHVTMRFLGGLSTGFLREETSSTFTGIRTGAFAGPFSMNQTVTSNFTGVGPRIGIHADYDTDSGFGFLGEGAVSALIGALHTKTNFTGSAQELSSTFNQAVNYQNIEDQNVHQVIPGIDAKLGIDYKHAFSRNTVLTISAGYQAAVYVNAISQYVPASLVSGQPLESGGIFVATMSHTLSNYSVQGPFLNFALKLN